MNSFIATPLKNPTDSRLRVVIVDDHEMVAMLFKDLLNVMGGYEVAGHAKDSAEAVALCKREQPDLIMLDLGLPDRPGLRVLRELRKLCPEAKVLICSGNVNGPVVREALLMGAMGIIGKAVPLDELKSAIRSVSAGRTYLCRQSSEAVRQMVQAVAMPPLAATELSGRERTVLRHIAAGLSSKEIAAKLGLSCYTIGNFRSKLSKKTGLRRAAQLSRYAAQIGLIDELDSGGAHGA